MKISYGIHELGVQKERENGGKLSWTTATGEERGSGLIFMRIFSTVSGRIYKFRPNLVETEIATIFGRI